MGTDQIPIHGVLSLVLTQGIDRVADFCNVAHNFSYYMAESVFAVRLVNLRSVTLEKIPEFPSWIVLGFYLDFHDYPNLEKLQFIQFWFIIWI